MKVLASVSVLTAAAAARIINGAQLTPFAGANVKVATNQSETVTRLNDYEYVIVGSGAGGAPLASRLAMAGYSVLLLEAGDDETSLIQQIVPGLHPISTEVEAMRWDYFIKPFDSDTENRRSEKMTYTLTDGSRYTGANPPSGAKTLGLLYPRAGTLGGCTTHNALISVTPQESDWKHLQNVSGDATFAPATMRNYLTQLEKATYVPSGTAGHGFNGWYEITTADLSVAVEDSKTISMIVAAATKAGNRVSLAILSTLSGLTKFLSGDANSASASRDTTQSLYRIPIAMKRPSYERSGPLDLLRQVLNAKNADGTEKYKLDVQLNTLATKVVFDRTGAKPRATGIDFSLGASLYGADPRRQSGAVTGTGTPGTVRATREVILSAGSFNTPQLLKLSGVGPAAELQSFNIPVVVNLPGVGKNLQDRYEAPVVARAQQPFDTIKNCTFGFTPDDYCMNRWKNGPQGNKGLYSSNGGPISYVMKTSQSENGDADLMILGLAGISLTGYYPGWPVNGTAGGNAWTWVTLKSHSRNNAGTVTLRSTNPQDMPEIVMRNFAVGGDADLTAAIEGTKWARSAIQSAYHPDTTFTEDWPGPGVQTDAQWKDWLKHTAWGHHACCTAKIGSASDPDAVLDGQFRVRGVDGLRVVDASSWSKIPGFYIVLPQYILGQKAADDIIAAAKAA